MFPTKFALRSGRKTVRVWIALRKSPRAPARATLRDRWIMNPVTTLFSLKIPAAIDLRCVTEGEAPNPKLQAPKKLQTPSSKPTPAVLGIWILEFPWSLELGIWSFTEDDYENDLMGAFSLPAK